MIEVVYEKEKQKPEGNEAYFRIPNNIRQIGEAVGTQKIYIEDYAYTYLCRISSENSSSGKAAILLGQVNWKDNISYLFVKSAVALPEMEITEEHLNFTKDIWNHVYEKNKEFFPNQEIIGWFLSIPGCSMELHQVICKTHLDHFGGNDKVLMVMEPTEKEEAFYRYEGGRLTRQPGFYVYYEKNEPMQSFLVTQNEKSERKSEKVEDQAVKNFRKKTEKKSGVKKQEKSLPVFRAASICAVLAVLAAGVLYLNDYHKLRDAQQPVSELKERTEEQKGTTPVNGYVSDGDAKEKEEEIKEEAEDTERDQKTEATDEEKPDVEQKEEKNGSDTAKENEEQNESNNMRTEEMESSVGDTETAAETGNNVYTIKAGDTITSISIQHYGSIQKISEICALNGLSPEDFIYPGQKILLP